MVLNNLMEGAQKEKGSTNGMDIRKVKKCEKNHDKETPDKINICNLPKSFFEKATAQNL